MKRIGVIFISIILFIGVFITPVFALSLPSPSYSFGVENNLLNYDSFSLPDVNGFASFRISGDLLGITSTGDGTPNYLDIFDSSNLVLSPGDYQFGFLRINSKYSYSCYLYFDGSLSNIITDGSPYSFSLDSPTQCYFQIFISAENNSSVSNVYLRPYLIYDNDTSDGILHAFQGSILSFFNGLKCGLLLISDSLIGVDKLPTNLGYIFLLTVGFILCVFIIDLIIQFIAGLIHGRRCR